MTSLECIQNFLNIEIDNRRLRNGKKKHNKNCYYYYKDLYYIVKLTKDHWMIAEDNNKTRQLLRLYYWYSSSHGYVKTYSMYWHQAVLNYEHGLVADHINHNRFDNRMNNLRIVTPRENQRNKHIYKANTSGKQGLCLWTNIKNGRKYWKVQIQNNNCHCIAKYFSIDRHGIDHAKVMAIESRRELEEQYGYIGD